MKNNKTTKAKSDLKNNYINTRCTSHEYQTIKEKAANTGLSSSAYLRNLGMNYPIKSVADQRALSELIKCKSDLGRLGGLFKLWLESENATWGNLGDRRYEDISDLLDDLMAKENELLDIARKLLEK